MAKLAVKGLSHGVWTHLFDMVLDNDESSEAEIKEMSQEFVDSIHNNCVSKMSFQQRRMGIFVDFAQFAAVRVDYEE